MTNTTKKRRLVGKEENMERDGQVEYEELRVASTRLASCEDLDSLESLSEAEDNLGLKARKSRQPFLYRLWKFLRVTATGVIKRDKPSYLHLELPQRYRPSTIASLCQSTGFSRVEVKRLYWSFKNDCPTGLVNRETFHTIFSKFFPTGANLSCYSHYIFSTMDHQKTGLVTFEAFACLLSILLTGSLEDRLRWTFQLYDINKDGVVSRAEVREVTLAIYDLMGHPAGERQKSEANDQNIARRAEMAFQKLDLDQDGVITLEEFMRTCLEDQKMVQSFHSLDVPQHK